MRDQGSLVGARTAAEVIGIDRSTLFRWIDKGRLIPAHKLDAKTGAYLFDLDHVLAVGTEWRAHRAARRRHPGRPRNTAEAQS